MNATLPEGAAGEESGYLLIADMENSTGCKFRLGPARAFSAMRKHNRLVIRHATAGAGVVLNSLGDAVVAKFPDAGDALAALDDCLRAARAIIEAFEALEPLATAAGEAPFRLRTKLLLQRYEAYRYAPEHEHQIFSEELVGQDIDVAFRLAPLSWRLQVLVTEKFLQALCAADECGSGALSPQGLLDRAHLSRHYGARGADRLTGISETVRFRQHELWVTDAREVARLKGIADSRRVFALSFVAPATLNDRGDTARLTIKVRQEHHAMILAKVSLTQPENENYIAHVVDRLRDASDGNRLDSELSLLAAAKIFGEFDFFFRVSCIDDYSLQRFFRAIHDDAIGVHHVEVRSTISNRLAVTPHYETIRRRIDGRPYELVLAWFEREAERDLFTELVAYMNEEADNAVTILEVGEVIFHLPVYAVFVCDSLDDYATFFDRRGLRPTGCRSHVGHIGRAADAQLRYSLVDALYMPRAD